MSSSIRHLKLVTGEEVICDVLDESPESLIINNAMGLTINTLENGDKFFTFKTYMVYQDTPTSMIIMFTDKIMSMAIPSTEMVEQYTIAVKEIASYLDDKYDEEGFSKSLSEMLDDMAEEDSKLDSDVKGMVMN